MKILFQHISLVLLAIFTVTFVPFNALHHHAEEDHFAYVHAHKTIKNHHCELDSHFCQKDLEPNCGHSEHIKNTLENCFTCDFHFIKHFDQIQSISLLLTESGLNVYNSLIVKKVHQTILFISNKGPPRIV